MAAAIAQLRHLAQVEGFAVHLDGLSAALATLSDRRDARGLRHALVTVLVYVILAKSAAEYLLRGTTQ